VLVDRLWPRGMTRQRAKVDAWPKDVAPSTALRLWFRHDRERWEQFRRRYKAELADNPALDDLRALLRGHKHVTLLYGAKVTDHNHAIVLRETLVPNGTRRRRARP
jgi:uncharacterized protein YeaO (DUF488 family)